MKAYVDVEGSGIGTTTITRSGGVDWFNGTVRGASNSELRQLSVVSTGGTSQAVAIVAQDVNPFSVRWVDAEAWGSDENAAILVHGDGAHADLYGSSFTATGGTNAFAVYYSGGCSATMNLSEANASGASGSNLGRQAEPVQRHSDHEHPDHLHGYRNRGRLLVRPFLHRCRPVRRDPKLRHRRDGELGSQRLLHADPDRLFAAERR